MPDKTDKLLSRRKAMTRLGGAAFAAYTIPAFTMLSAAHAASAASAASAVSAASAGSSASAASAGSSASGSSGMSDPSAMSEPSLASTPSMTSGASGQQILTPEQCTSSGGTIVDAADGTQRCVKL